MEGGKGYAFVFSRLDSVTEVETGAGSGNKVDISTGDLGSKFIGEFIANDVGTIVGSGAPEDEEE